MHAMLPLCIQRTGPNSYLSTQNFYFSIYQESIIVFEFFIINFNKTSNGKLLIFSRKFTCQLDCQCHEFRSQGQLLRVELTR